MTTSVAPARPTWAARALAMALSFVLRWLAAAVSATAFWALLVVYLEATDPSLLLPDPVARLRWVLVAGAVCGALQVVSDRPLRGPASGLADAEPPIRARPRGATQTGPGTGAG